MKAWEENDESYLIEFKALEAFVDYVEFNSLTPSEEVPTSTQFINQFSNIFQAPDFLPPQREIDHHIHLKEGMQPVNV